MNRKPFLLLAGLVASLISCSGDKYDAEESADISSTEATAKLRVTVADQSGGALLDGATVTLLSTGEEQNAPAEFTGLKIGEYQVLAKAEGYATRRVPTEIVNDIIGAGTGNRNSVNHPKDKREVILLPKKSATMEGYLYTEDKYGKYTVPMSGVTVRVTIQTMDIFSSNLVTDTTLLESVFEVTTGADGKYSFINLPAVGTLYEIVFIGSSKDPSFGTMFGNVTNYPLLDGAKTDRGNFEYEMWRAQQNIPFILLPDWKKELLFEEAQAGTPLEFKFSSEINTESINVSTVMVCRYPNTSCSGDSYVVPVNVSWDAASVTISPVSGKWADSMYVRFIGLRSLLNQTLSSGVNLVQVFAKNISDVTVENFEANVIFDSTGTVSDKHLGTSLNKASRVLAHLSWDKVEGATGYEIHRKDISEGVTDADYELLPPSINKDTNKVTIDISSYGKTKYLFAVRAKNGYTHSLFSAPVEIADTFAPDFADGQRVWDSYCGGTCQDSVRVAVVKPAADTTILFYDMNVVHGPILNDSIETKYGLSSKLLKTSGEPVTYGRIFFNKAMDDRTADELRNAGITDTLAWKCSAVGQDACKRLAIQIDWLNNQNLSVTLITTSGAALALGSVDAVFTITGLRGANGLPFTTVYGGTVAKNSVSIRVRTTINDCSFDQFATGCRCDVATATEATLLSGSCCKNPDNITSAICTSTFNACQLYGTDAENCHAFCREELIDNGTNKNDGSVSVCKDNCFKRDQYDDPYIFNGYFDNRDGDKPNAYCNVYEDEFCGRGLYSYYAKAWGCQWSNNYPSRTHCYYYPGELGCPDFCNSNLGYEDFMDNYSIYQNVESRYYQQQITNSYGYPISNSWDNRFYCPVCTDNNPTDPGCACYYDRTGTDCQNWCTASLYRFENNATCYNNSSFRAAFCGRSLSNFRSSNFCKQLMNHCDYFDATRDGEGCGIWCAQPENAGKTGSVSSIYDGWQTDDNYYGQYVYSGSDLISDYYDWNYTCPAAPVDPCLDNTDVTPACLAACIANDGSTTSSCTQFNVCQLDGSVAGAVCDGYCQFNYSSTPCSSIYSGTTCANYTLWSSSTTCQNQFSSYDDCDFEGENSNECKIADLSRYCYATTGYSDNDGTNCDY